MCPVHYDSTDSLVRLQITFLSNMRLMLRKHARCKKHATNSSLTYVGKVGQVPHPWYVQSKQAGWTHWLLCCRGDILRFISSEKTNVSGRSKSPGGRVSGNDFGRYLVPFLEGRISDIRAAYNYPTRNANFKSRISDIRLKSVSFLVSYFSCHS